MERPYDADIFGREKMRRRVRRIEHDGCIGCRYEKLDEHLEPCLHCDGTKQGDKYKKMTNADRIREMTDEELADFLCSVKSDYQWINQDYPSEEEAGEWIEWLQSEADQKGQEL